MLIPRRCCRGLRGPSQGPYRTFLDVQGVQRARSPALYFFRGGQRPCCPLAQFEEMLGVIAYSVAQRTQEVGIRRALGAQEAGYLLLVLRHRLVLALSGGVLGLGGRSRLLV